MDARKAKVSVLACASLLAACSPTVEAQVGATVPPSIPAAPAAPQSERATPMPTPTRSPASTPRSAPTASKANSTERPLPDIFYKEPRDPIKAYRNLIARHEYMSSQKRMLPPKWIFIPGTPTYRHRLGSQNAAMRKGIRYVGGSTELKLTLLSRGADRAVIDVRDRESGWKRIDDDGRLIKRLPPERSHYIAFMERLPEGWRVTEFARGS